MGRVKLHELANYAFHHQLNVRVTDLNYAGHLGNVAAIGLIHEARARTMNALGLGELNLGDDQTGFIMADLQVNYLQRGFLFDTVQADVHLGEIRHRSFRIFYRLRRNDENLVLAETGMIAYNYTSRGVVSLPQAFLDAVKKHQAE